jgi:hypothetical protein
VDERRVPAEHVPHRQASFHDGVRAAVLCEAILTAAEEGRRIEIEPVTNALGV